MRGMSRTHSAVLSQIKYSNHNNIITIQTRLCLKSDDLIGVIIPLISDAYPHNFSYQADICILKPLSDDSDISPIISCIPTILLITTYFILSLLLIFFFFTLHLQND